ncbi:DUF1272 domain-containing protein [Deinococcus apachensis]|uniref:DUF1272 domain-containing protein n=1 Tax=Deinococcus apachensis TaxID=309886 RepID=UPI000A006480|nr:DUF1272 domain-containing protein [Deinococcus apachensis]
MLKMKSACERCSVPLPADGEATICSFECTFCPTCTELMHHTCPNCGGELVQRPRRTRSAASAAAGSLVRRVRSNRVS